MIFKKEELLMNQRVSFLKKINKMNNFNKGYKKKRERTQNKIIIETEEIMTLQQNIMSRIYK